MLSEVAMKYKTGMIVRHKLASDWGHGKITEVEDQLLIVKFSNVGLRYLDPNIAPLELINEAKSNIQVNSLDNPSRSVNTDIEFFAKPPWTKTFRDLQTKAPPDESGIYGWYFNEIPPYVPYKKCAHTRPRLKKWRLLYIGKGKSLKKRILGFHFNGDADVSTLRLSLGCLLIKHHKLCLYKRLSKTEGKYDYTFGDKGEKEISNWMKKNTRVAWVASPNYETLEKNAIHTYTLPLNIKENPNLFVPLKTLRSRLKGCAIPRGSKRPHKAINKAYDEFKKACKKR